MKFIVDVTGKYHVAEKYKCTECNKAELVLDETIALCDCGKTYDLLDGRDIDYYHVNHIAEENGTAIAYLLSTYGSISRVPLEAINLPEIEVGGLLLLVDGKFALIGD